MKRLTKPRMKSLWRGQPGNKYRAYFVYVNGKEFYHGENRANAKRQYDAALRFYNKAKANRKKNK